jgi:hypothetical protein
LGQRFTLIAPPFGQKPGDEENLAACSIQSVATDQLPIGAFQFEWLRLSHSSLGLEQGAHTPHRLPAVAVGAITSTL